MTEKVTKIASFDPTAKQRKWVDRKGAANKKAGRSGGQAQVMRDLIDNAMRNEK